jgi:polar amino acid transport system substrate-binding protein
MLPILFGVWLVCAFGAARGGEITLCADAWCPYNCVPDSSQPGYAVEIAQRVFGETGDTVRYSQVNWARCVEDARQGRFTGIIGAIPADAPDFIFPHQPLGHSGDAYAFRRGDNFRFTGAASLDGRVLGVVRSYSFAGPIGAYIAAHGTDGSRVEWVSGNGALIKNLAKLVARRIDVVVDDGNVLRNAIAALGLQDRLQVTEGPNVAPVFIAFSPADPRSHSLAAQLDAGIARLRASGELAEIKAKYHATDRP